MWVKSEIRENVEIKKLKVYIIWSVDKTEYKLLKLPYKRKFTWEIVTGFHWKPVGYVG